MLVAILPRCVWSKPGPGCDPVSCQTAPRGNSQPAGRWPRGSGLCLALLWLLPQAAGAVLSQELLTWKVHSSESRGTSITTGFFSSLLYKNSLEEITLVVRVPWILVLSEESWTMRPGIKAVDLVFILMHFYGYGCHKPSMKRYKLKEQCFL